MRSCTHVFPGCSVYSLYRCRNIMCVAVEGRIPKVSTLMSAWVATVLPPKKKATEMCHCESSASQRGKTMLLHEQF